ncbi:MAG: chromosome segregation protein SMC [Acidobacteria bacterium]|nr:chromosome segregation protein SMC [Acidobacteriota bacterium]
MLKLKKVELLGFKSFCDRTEMQFNGGGVAAIVGPNGCGKSNLSDAVSWVLGEQSARLLRGTRMEDVIFNGTRDRKPLGMAAVTMTLFDPEVYFYAPAAAPGGTEGPTNGEAAAAGARGRRKTQPAERPGEIVVTRRLFRSGESEYLLNGRACRLRDIQEIFMGTGLGPECYAIIEQGRIGQILSSRPYDRRAVVEEAAGITKFKTKKKLAEAKLESARQNLARVSDILEEVGRQANSLKRQAAKARRYEQLRAEMTAKLAVALGGRHRVLERETIDTALEMNLAAEDFRARFAQAEQMEAEHGALQKESYEMELLLQARRDALAAAVMETDRARQRMAYQARSVEENSARILQAEVELAAIERRLEELGQELAAERAALEAVTAEAGEARARLAGQTAELDALQFQVRKREAEQEGLRQTVLRLLGEVSSLRNQLAQIEEFQAGVERQSARVRSEEAAARQEREELTVARQARIEKLATQQQELCQLEERRRQGEASLARRKEQAQGRRQRAESLRDEISRMQARRQSLEEILSHRAYTTETVKNLFAAIEQGRLGEFRVQGILADFMEVESNYERAVEEFLREELEYVVVSGWGEAEEGMRLLRAEMEGHATFLVTPESEPGGKLPALETGTGILGRLEDHVRLSGGLVIPRLGRCYLAQDETAARRVCRQYPDLYFVLPDGRCYHGNTLSGGRKASSGPLALKRELRELVPRLAAGVQELQAETAALENMEAEIARESQQTEALRTEMQEREKEAIASEQDLRQLDVGMSRSNSRLAVARLESERLAEESRRAAAEQSRAQTEVDQREAARYEAEGALAALRLAIAQDQERAARAVEEQAELRARLAALEERRKAVLASSARVEQLLSGEARRREEQVQQIAVWTAERGRLLEDNRQLAVQIEALAARHGQLEREAQKVEAALLARRSRMAEIEESLKTVKQELEQARERRSAVEIQLVRLQSDIKHLEETCRHELGRSIGEICASVELPLDPEAAAQAEQEYLQLKEKIEALGPVNVLALEEYQEAQQRYDFLEAQRQDLIDSIRDTQQAITEIDGVSRRQFLEAFNEINRHFRQTFTILFGGGIGEMRLTDENNIAESGIDIVASPPGKRLQNVLLLSGGEKALTAIALLMAVFRYQPSPFCVLDEVDAPLDDANVVRFTRLIREMSEQTQFILITHNKTTMEVAQTLYGVTMPEPGVSKLVSVKFEEAPEPQPRPMMPPPAPAIANVARV